MKKIKCICCSTKDDVVYVTVIKKDNMLMCPQCGGNELEENKMKEKTISAAKKYRDSKKGKAAAKKYRDSKKGKAAAKKYRDSKKLKAVENTKGFQIGTTVIHKENKKQYSIVQMKNGVASIENKDDAKAVKVSTLKRYYKCK